MKNMFVPIVVLLALSGAPALAQNSQGQNNNNQGGGGGVYGAPGPLLGAGPLAILIGGGIYWLVRRKKRPSTD
jgi:hypothetical protein